MKKEKPIARRAGNLRRRAEATLKKKRGKLARPLAEEDARALVHELQVHQVELEMQNEELRRANLEVEEALNKYSDLYDFSPVGYFTFDKQGKIPSMTIGIYLRASSFTWTVSGWPSRRTTTSTTSPGL